MTHFLQNMVCMSTITNYIMAHSNVINAALLKNRGDKYYYYYYYYYY